MPSRSGRLGPKEVAYAKYMAATGDKHYSAAKAGYADPVVGAHRNEKRPAVHAEIARIQTDRLFNDLLPAAVNCLQEIITSPKAPAGARVQAAKLVMDRTLGGDDARNGKEPHEMTGEELANAINQLERIAAERARPVDAIEVEPVANDSQEGGIFE